MVEVGKQIFVSKVEHVIIMYAFLNDDALVLIIPHALYTFHRSQLLFLAGKLIFNPSI